MKKAGKDDEESSEVEFSEDEQVPVVENSGKSFGASSSFEQSVPKT